MADSQTTKLVVYSSISKSGVALVTLNRPNAKNAINPEVAIRLSRLWKTLRDDPNVKVIVLTGTGDCFCSGGDLVELIPLMNQERTPVTEYEKEYLKEPNSLWEALLRDFDPKKPVIAAINGHAIAGGMEIVEGTDIRVAYKDALFGLQEAKWSLFPLGGSTVRMPAQVPYAIAMEILLTAKLFPASKMKEIGFLNYVVSTREEVLTKALEIAETIAANGPYAIQMIRESVKACLGIPEIQGLQKEYEIGSKVFLHPDAKEGPKAFKEKRKPNWITSSKL